MAAMRLSFTWFGVRKSLTAAQRAEAAEAFGADGDVLSAGKTSDQHEAPQIPGSDCAAKPGSFVLESTQPALSRTGHPAV